MKKHPLQDIAEAGILILGGIALTIFVIGLADFLQHRSF